MKTYDFSHLTVSEMFAELAHLKATNQDHLDYYFQLLKELNRLTT